jgi:hypothetical protein
LKKVLSTIIGFIKIGAGIITIELASSCSIPPALFAFTVHPRSSLPSFVIWETPEF